MAELSATADGSTPTKKENLKLALERLQKPRNFPNFIDAYLQFTANQESTKKIHTWVALSIIAAAMERKAYLHAGHFTIFPNLYIFVIGESGVVRKSTSTGIGVDLLRSLDDVQIMSERVTAGSLIQQLERAKREFSVGDSTQRQSAVFCYASELVVFLREVYGSISELLTTFYDCSPNDSSKPWIYETKGEGQVKIFGPCLNILGASTPSWLTKAIPAEEMEGGFSSRVIFVVEKENPDLFVAWPELQPEVEALKPKLIEDLQQIHSLRGSFKKTPEAHRFYEEWYIDYKKRALKETDARFKGYYGRKPTTIIKLAMALSAAESNDLIFDQRHIEGAISLLNDLEISMLDAFGATGKNILAEPMEKIRLYIQERQSVSHKEVMRLFWRDLNGNELTSILADLGKMDLIETGSQGGQVIYRWKKAKELSS